MDALTRRVLEFLSQPASYDHRPASVRLVQTHASWVFLASPFVCKIKKPVDFGFLNFTTLERRRTNCETEVLLNRRLAADVYVSTLAIRDTDGVLSFHGDGPVVEWAVWMKELDASTFLSHRLREGRCSPGHIEQIATTLCTFYQAQPAVDGNAALLATQRVQSFVHENFVAIRKFTFLPSSVIDAIESFCQAFELSCTSLLTRRANEGSIRDGHGDLHSEHISLNDQGTINIFDCLEFNEDLRVTDVACDLAFLAMDLDFNQRHDFSTLLIQRATSLLSDSELQTVIPYYQCYRACVRCKVELLHSVAETAAEPERMIARTTAERYLQLALRYSLTGTERCIVAFMGGVASGKSFLAGQLSDITGWKVFSSDRIRKDIAGIAANHRGTDEERQRLYQPEMTAHVYHRLFECAANELEHHPCVILDATFSSRADRESLAAFCRRSDIRLQWIEAHAPVEIVRQRLVERALRPDVVSDARAEDFEKLTARYEPPLELQQQLIRVSTDDSSDRVRSNLMTAMARKNGNQA
ncbi:MAG: AAA family ATPase [Planctomycetaceae bacterium]|nr:AAA family ATPase [Planctomycetaceae bacterium]